MTDHDDVLKQLDAALQVEPSRAFADGVRARVNRSRINSTRMWWGLAAAASIGLATFALWRPSVEVPVQVADAPIQTPAPVVPTRAPESIVAMAPLAPSAPAPRKAITAPVTVTTVASEPRLEVITNQGALLRELWAGVGRGVAVETAIVATPVTAAEVKPITPMVLDPLVVPPLVVTQIGKEPGRDGATP